MNNPQKEQLLKQIDTSITELLHLRRSDIELYSEKRDNYAHNKLSSELDSIFNASVGLFGAVSFGLILSDSISGFQSIISLTVSGLTVVIVITKIIFSSKIYEILAVHYDKRARAANNSNDYIIENPGKWNLPVDEFKSNYIEVVDNYKNEILKINKSEEQELKKWKALRLFIFVSFITQIFFVSLLLLSELLRVYSC